MSEMFDLSAFFQMEFIVLQYGKSFQNSTSTFPHDIHSVRTKVQFVVPTSQYY